MTTSTATYAKSCRDKFAVGDLVRYTGGSWQKYGTYVVLVTGEAADSDCFDGVVVFTENKFMRLGTYSNTFSQSGNQFEPFVGSVTLASE